MIESTVDIMLVANGSTPHLSHADGPHISSADGPHISSDVKFGGGEHADSPYISDVKIQGGSYTSRGTHISDIILCIRRYRLQRASHTYSKNNLVAFVPTIFTPTTVAKSPSYIGQHWPSSCGF